ncbi:Uma2 family endonuclease [Streptomyces sp. NBC_01465]|uniref:Uma2 family endonuclease n=1 Tax=Streptomyces sp. NBC_01465 TaxID=2903878 RepID=UPI002E361A15|nr:Uma2 family endonuclease [Streptomyces sp. NBC_01465]
MTPSTAEHAQMTVEEFEQIAHHAPETVRLEFINGRLVVKAMPDGNHSEMLMWLVRQCMQQRPELNLMPERGVKAEAYRKGRARADAVLAPRRHFRGHGEWSDTEGILMAVEITSRDADTNQRDRIDKPIGYAEADIPVYLLIDRDDDTLTVYSEPKDGTYQQHPSYPFGAEVALPDPVGITLDTEELKDYAS